MPSENQLVQAFGMSRPTVVRALELLKHDGWLESRQG
nr:GntR family transcriptional regulator [Streptomyces hokutonensis]